MRRPLFFLTLVLVGTGLTWAQSAPGMPVAPQQLQAQQPQPAPNAAQPAPASTAPAQQPAQPTPAPATVAQAAPPLSDNSPFELNGASLTEMINILARRLRINYVLDPAVKGSVTIYTYGEVKSVDLMSLLQTILRINGFSMVQVGDLYRIVPIKMVTQLPITPTVNSDPNTLPDDERMILNLIFLKYATAAEVMKLIEPFMGEGGRISSYDPSNLLIIEDNSRSLKRTMELIGMFDSDAFAGQRVRLFEITNSRPSDLAKELDTVFKAYSLSERNSAVRFIPVDRINTLIAVCSNPGTFDTVKTWIGKLDIAVKAPAGAADLFYYRLKYGRAETVAMALTAVLTGNPWAMIGLANSASNGTLNGSGYSGYGMGMGSSGTSYGAGAYGYGGLGSASQTTQQTSSGSSAPISVPNASNANPMALPTANSDMTGAYLGMAATRAGAGSYSGPTVIPNPFDNTLLVKGTPQEWEQIKKLLAQIDVPPRQVLIDAKIYEVDLTGAFSAGVTAYLQKRSGSSRSLAASSVADGLSASIGALVLRSHELLLALSANESASHTRLLSSPSIIATDSVPATMNVGQDVPILTSQAVVSGVSSGGSSVFTNQVTYRSSGVTLNITARINSSGVVTMTVDQDVSSPQAASSTSSIQSSSFQRRAFNTQVTVQDGDTIAIGGFIQETNLTTSNGVPILHRIPVIGAAFGGKSTSKARTELIVFLTPRVIYDTNQVADATDEIRNSVKKIQKSIKEAQ
jgi:general secretion pathway protein D